MNMEMVMKLKLMEQATEKFKIHIVGKNVIDVYVGDTNGCHCNSNPINGRRYVEF